MEVGTILWAKNRPSDHNNHLHVEPPTRMSGTPPLTNPGKTPGVQAIYDALVVEFGPGKYFQESGVANWTHMGGWNRRKIAGTDIWSQHAWWNALDIGPYYGVADQQRFYDFLTGQTPNPPPIVEVDMYAPVKEGDRGVAVEAWQRVIQRISGFNPKEWGVFGPDTTVELQRLTGPGNNIGPSEGAVLLDLLGASDSGGLTEAQVKAIVNSAVVHVD